MDAFVTPEGLTYAGLEPRVLDYPTARVATEDVQTLIIVIQDLLSRVTADTDSELGRARRRTEHAVAAARAAIAVRAVPRVRKTGGTEYSDSSLFDRPGVLLGLTTLVVAVGICAGWSRRARR